MRLFIRTSSWISRSRFHTSASWHIHRSLREFKLADIGEGITECEVIKWSVKPSTSVQVFDPLCEVQSDKATVEITSPFDGIVQELLVKEGDIAKVGAGLCTIEVEEKNEANPKPVGQYPNAATVDQVPPHNPTPSSRTTISEHGRSANRKPQLHPLDPRISLEPTPTPGTGSSTEHILATPSVRHFARQQGVDLVQLVPGSGKLGRIERRDVEAFLGSSASRSTESPQSRSESVHAANDVIVELGRTRSQMWKAMTKSLEIPQFGFSTSLDLTTLQGFLPIMNANIPSHYLPLSNRSPIPSGMVLSPPDTHAIPESACYTRLTFLPFLMKTLSKAMMEWPLFRSSITPSSQSSELSSNKPTLTVRPHVDIGVALSTPSGLYTPTVQQVDTHSVYAIASRLKYLTHLGRQTPCALTPVEMPKRGGTITISNVGGVGDVDYASPILVPGGGIAIVAIGRAKWVWDVNRGSGAGERRFRVGVSWSADHRVVEGAELIAFVESWRRWIENPEQLIADGI